MGLARWLDDFANKQHKQELTKKAGLESESHLTNYIYKTNETLTHEQFERAAKLISEDNDFSEQKIADIIATIRDQDKAASAKKNFEKLSQITRDESCDEKLNEINLFVQGSVSTGFSKNASRNDVESKKAPETFQEALNQCEKKLDYVLSSNEYVELQKFAERKKLAKKAMPQIVSELENWIGIQKLAKLGRSINKSNKIQTVRNQIEAGLESFENLQQLSVQEEAENLRYLPGGYDRDKDARDDDVRRQVEQENDSNKRIKKEKGVDRTMGLKHTAAKEGEEEEKEIKYKLKTPTDWDMKGTPKGYGKQQGKEPAGEGKKLVDRFVDAIDEIREKMKPVQNEIANLKDTLKKFTSEELAPLEKQEGELLQKLGKVVDRMDEADDVLIDHRDKQILLQSKYDVEKKGSFQDFIISKMEEEGMLEKVESWKEEFNKIEEKIKGISYKTVQRFTKKSGLFVKAEENIESIFEEINEVLDNTLDVSDIIIDEISDFEFELDSSIEDYHEGEEEEEIIDDIEEGINDVREEIELPKAANLKKSAVRGKPNDIDKCRDCTYYNSGIGTTYYKCSTCIHAYSEEELDNMGKDINELGDYFNDRGVTEVSDSASNYSKKHASLKSEAQQPAVAPPKPGTKPEAPPAPSREPGPRTPPSREPFDPFKTPGVTPAPQKNVTRNILNKMEKCAGYEEEVEPSIKEFWQNMPEKSIMSRHPIISKHGRELNQKSFDYLSGKAPDYNPEEGPAGYMQKVVPVLQKIIELEAEHKEQLEDMAKDIGVKIFGIDKNMLEADLEEPTAENQSMNEPEIAEMTPELEQHVNKRVTINALTHGSAAHIYLTAHHMIDEAIKAISPELLDLYNKFAGGTLKAYWLINYYDKLSQSEDVESAEQKQIQDSGVGESHVEKDEEGNKKVVAKGVIFPALVHEVVKGIMELLSHHGMADLKPEEVLAVYKEADTLKDEQWLLQVGSEMWRRFNAVAQKFLQDIPEEETENFTLAHVVALVNQQPPDIIHDFMDKVITNPDEALQALHEITGVIKKEGETFASSKDKFQKISQGNRGFGNPKTDKERLERHKRRFPEENVNDIDDLPPRGTGLRNSTDKDVRRRGNPRTNKERLQRHKRRFPEEGVSSIKDLPPRGTGLNNKLSERDRGYGFPRTEEERLERHQGRFPNEDVSSVEDLPPRGTGYQRDLLPGGLADDMTEEDIAKKHNVPIDKINKQKNKGIEVEKEHTDNEEIAGEIAEDHLVESDEYYTHLEEMEKKFGKKKESDPSLKPPKKWWDGMKKDVKKKNPDYSDEQIEKTIGDIWHNKLSKKKKEEIRGREGKTYGKAPKKAMRREANGSESTPLYTVKSPSGEEIEVTPGQLAMSQGWVTDSKGNKFKPESFEPKSLEERLGFRVANLQKKIAVTEFTGKDATTIANAIVKAYNEKNYSKIKNLGTELRNALNKVKNEEEKVPRSKASAYQNLLGSDIVKNAFENVRQVAAWERSQVSKKPKEKQKGFFQRLVSTGESLSLRDV